MPLDEREKEELAKKITEQRRSMWKGEVTEKRRPKKKQDHKNTVQMWERQRERKKTKQALDRQLDKPKAKSKNRDIESKVPALRLALLVIVGLIAAIIIGVAVGYLAAVRDLISI